jgi:putative transposase
MESLESDPGGGSGHVGSNRGRALDRVIARHGKPKSITVDHGTEFTSRALDEWAYRRGIALDFIRPGKPVENGHIESFNGKLRDECLNANQFLSIDDAKGKIEAWWLDYNLYRPHSTLGQLSPAQFLNKVATQDEKANLFLF